MPAANHAHKHQLKPCPFCGSTDLTLDHLVDKNDWFVSCNICEIQQLANYTEAQAVALWNRRAVSESIEPVFDGPDKNIGPAHWGKTTQGKQ